LDRYYRISDATLIGTGHTVAFCIQAAERLEREHGLEVRVINMSSLKPVNEQPVLQIFDTTKIVVTVEDHGLGGLFDIVAGIRANCLHSSVHTPVIPIRVQDCFGESGEPDELYERYGIGPGAIYERVMEVTI
jgi:transketolase